MEALLHKLVRGLHNGNWCGCRELRPDILRGGETFWLLNHSRKESKRAGSNHAPGPLPFQQRTNTSCYLAIPTHGFTVVLSVFWGTPPAKPLKCKSVSNRLGARFRQRWTESTGGKPRLSCASIRLVLSDIIKTSFSFYSQRSAFRYQVSLLFQFCMGKQKTLLPFR